MAKQKKLTGRQIGILAILIEENLKQFPTISIKNWRYYDSITEVAARKALIKSINNCSELPNYSAKILDNPVEMLFEYYGIL